MCRLMEVLVRRSPPSVVVLVLRCERADAGVDAVFVSPG